MSDNPTKFAFVWFTYSLDHPIILRSVKAARTFFPGAKMYVVDDTSENKALPKRAIQALARMGCTFIPTSTPRRGNLRGWACAKMIASTYKWIMDTEPADVLVKMDSDALLLSPDWIYKFAADPTYRYGGMRSKCHRSVCGPTYALKPDAVQHLWESYRHDMESPYNTEEDFELASRLCRAYNGDKTRIYQVPYSFNGMHPESADAEAGMFVFAQNAVKWYERIAEKWQEVVLGYPVRPYTGKTPQEHKAFVQANNLVKAAVMKRIFAARMRHALTATDEGATIVAATES